MPKLSQKTIAALRQLQRDVTANADSFDMRCWVETQRTYKTIRGKVNAIAKAAQQIDLDGNISSCGTVGCAAYFMALRLVPKGEEHLKAEYLAKGYVVDDDYHITRQPVVECVIEAYPDMRDENLPALGQSPLFLVGYWPGKLADAYTYALTPAEKAAALVAAVDDYIATDGWR